MIEILLTLFCLVVSFGFNNRKMKILSYCQAVLSFVLFFLVIILSPEFSFIFDRNSSFLSYIEAIRDVFLNFQYNGISIIKILLFAIVFLTILSIFTIIEYCRNKKCKKFFDDDILIQKKRCPTFIYIINKRKMYLRLSRLLN